MQTILSVHIWYSRNNFEFFSAHVRVARGALIAHRYTFAPPRCRSLQYRRTFIPLSLSLWNDLVAPVFDGVGLAGFKSRSNAFLLA